MNIAMLSGLIIFTVLLVMLLAGAPIAVSLGVSSILAILPILNTQATVVTGAQRIFSGISVFSLLAIPFFILAGNIMNRGGIAIRLINLAKLVTGRIPGALAHTNAVANMLFGAISGSGTAAASAMGSIIGPIEAEEGYDAEFSAAANIATAPTGLLIPPSNVMITFSLVSGGTSVAALFMAGYIPGILWGLACMIVIYIFAKKKGYKSTSSFKGKEKLMVIWQALPSLLMIVIVIGGIIGGIFTATEGSVVAVVYTLILSLFFYKTIKFKDLPEIFLASAEMTGIIVFLIGVSSIMSWVMAFTDIPTLVSNAGGAAARPFETHYNALNEDVKLRISLELYLKRLIVGGLERVYEIGRVFRNEGVDTRHNPEFTLMELYQAYTDYEGMMELTESMFRYLAEKVCGSSVISYNGTVIDMSKPFERITMIDAVKKYSGVDFNTVKTDEEAKAIAREHNVVFEERHKKGDIINLFFEEFCEEKMIQPTFVMDHPVEVSPLTKRKPSNPELVERFEMYIYGREMCNAYSELNDPIDQRERFKAQEEAFAAGDEEANHTDEDFLNALEIGMPPTGGIGYGIDRLVMLLTDSQAIRDVLLFPTMKTLDPKKAENKAEKAAVNGSAEDATVSAPSVQIDLSKVKIEPLFADDVDFETFSKSDFRVVKIEACEAVPKSKKLLKFTLNDGTDRKRTILSGIHEYYEPEELVGKTCVAITNLPPRKMMGIDSEGMLISAVYEYDGREGLNLLMLDDSIPAGAKLY